MQPNAEQMTNIIAAVIGFYAVFFLVMETVIIVPFWFILKKAGFTPWLSFLNLVPSLGTLILLYLLAFAEWKVVPAAVQAWVPPPPPPQA
jgi:hypothetical protein